jgi:iron(III) transport system permease protein
MWGRWSSRTVVIAIAALAFAVLCVWPVVHMLGIALPAWRHNALLDPRQRALLFSSTRLGLGTTILATIVGAPLGFVFARVDLRFKMAWRLLLVSPALVPPYVVALSWIYLHTGAPLSGVARLVPNPYSMSGAVVVLAVVFFPLSMLAAEVGVRSIDPRLEEAGLVVGSPATVLRRIIGRLAAPHVASVALVIFALAISEFSVPGLLRVRVFSTEVFSAFAARYDFAAATSLAVPLLLLAAAVAAMAASITATRATTTRRTRSALHSAAFSSWRQASMAAILCVAFATVLLPVATLATEARRYSSMLTLLGEARGSVVLSLVLASAGATAVTALGLLLGYARARASPQRGAMLDVLWILLFTVPSTVLGIGLIGIWNRPGVAGALYGTPGMIVIGYVARLAPIAALVLAATVQTVPVAQEEAAALAGVRWLPNLFRIVAPQIRLGLAAVWVVVFILAFGEVGTTILIAPPGESTLPIRVYTLIANAPPGQIAVLALFQTAVVLCPLTVLGGVMALRRRT